MQAIIAIVILICFFAFIWSGIGLLLQLFESIFGNYDYSEYLIMSVAEEPTGKLLIIFICSTIVFLICIFISTILNL